MRLFAREALSDPVKDPTFAAQPRDSQECARSYVHPTWVTHTFAYTYNAVLVIKAIVSRDLSASKVTTAKNCALSHF